MRLLVPSGRTSDPRDPGRGPMLEGRAHALGPSAQYRPASVRGKVRGLGGAAVAPPSNMGRIIMTHRVDVDHPHLHEIEPHSFSIDASDLGLAPSEWPTFVETNIGNGRRFFLTSADITAHYYRQEHGCVSLTIVND